MLSSLFWGFTAAALFVFAGFGKGVERGFALILVAGIAATWLIFEPRGGTDPLLLLSIDTAVLVSAAVLVFRTNKYWPIWFTGFQSLTVLTGVAHLISPDEVPHLFLNLSAFWFYPAIWCSSAGVILDWRAERNQPSS